MEFQIRNEITADQQEVFELNRAAFAGDAEAQLVDQLRAGQFAPISLVAEFGGRIVGHILFSPVTVIDASGREVACGLALAPLAVHPELQRRGIGGQLTRAGLNACRLQGAAWVVVLGHPEYYCRWGFSSETARSIECPFGSGAPWMAIELIPGSLAGIQGRVKYSAPFQAFE